MRNYLIALPLLALVAMGAGCTASTNIDASGIETQAAE